VLVKLQNGIIEAVQVEQIINDGEGFCWLE